MTDFQILMKLHKLWEEIKVNQDMVRQLGGSRPDVQEVEEVLPDTISSTEEMDRFNDRLLEPTFRFDLILLNVLRPLFCALTLG